MKKTLLSIVTITRNDRQGLSRTIGGVLKFVPFGAQHVIVDGSDEVTDWGAEVYRGGDATYIVQSSRGIANAFNEGLENVDGEWVWFLNGGDTVHEEIDPSWLLTLLRHTKADVILGAVQFDGDPMPRRMPLLKQQWPLMVCWPMHPAAIVRRRVLRGVGGFDRRWRVAMDYDLWFRVLNQHIRVDVISVCLARFDTKGISERSETQRLAEQEAALVLLLHSGKVLRDVIWLVARVFWKWLRALGVLFGFR